MERSDSVSTRRQMLAEWVHEWSCRHQAALRRERALSPVRAGGRTYLVTAAEAERALAQTHDELFGAFERRPSWGADGAGRPSIIAVRGLASRRLADRLRDALRSRGGRLHDADLDGDGFSQGALVLESSPIDGVDSFIALKQVLAREPRLTQEIVLRRALDETAAETAAALGLEAAAVRQRLSRFTRRSTEVLAA